MSGERLCDELKSALEYAPIEIPTHITENLGRELRSYQTTGLKHFLLQRKNPKTNHLMFNMATGSGKTLMMAALMLECYKNGYRDFVFFVNATTILEKTKANFTAQHDGKYLFKERIIIDGQNVEINAMENLNESKEGAINIYFTTIQALFSLLNRERENAPTLEDFTERKIVFLADEAHHLNADTKNKSSNQNETIIKEGWERIINKAFISHPENLMLEFTATIPKDKAVLEKYRDKTLYEYDLKRFCLEGYSKRIFLMKYENRALENRMLGGVLMSLYRELIAQEHGVSLKPVVLFKSEGVNPSKDNQKRFLELLENLEAKDIEEFYSHITRHKSELFYKSLEYFRGKFGESYAHRVREYLKSNFKEIFILNTNNEAEITKQQILLNSLENPDNVIRVIFCVDKLNEGWDTLNLFDIVRLGDKKSNTTITTKEVQLIGRGARYYPFSTPDTPQELAHKRKFDNKAEHPLSVLEYLSYHTFNDTSFIKELNESMTEQGLLTSEEYEKIILTPTPRARNITKNSPIYYAKNDRYKIGALESYSIKPEEMQQEIMELHVPLQARGVQETEEDFQARHTEEGFKALRELNEIPLRYFFKAMNKEKLGFDELRKNFPQYASKREFIEKYLAKISVNFDAKQRFNNPDDCLEMARYIIAKFKTIREKIKPQYEVSEFSKHRFQMYERVLFAKKGKVNESRDEWLYYDKYLHDSGLENKFLDFIRSNTEAINNAFEQWFIIRNDGFEEFKIYDNREDNLDGTYGRGFEPDFIFFGRRKGEEEFSIIQCFIEAKGEHLAGDGKIFGADTWKERFLSTLEGMHFDNDLKLEFLPFFRAISDANFHRHFKNFLQKQ